MTKDEVREFLDDEGENPYDIRAYLNFKEGISNLPDPDNIWIDMAGEDIRSDFDFFLLEIAYADLSPVQKFNAILV